MKEEIKSLKTETVYRRFQSIYETILPYYLKCRENTDSENTKLVRTKSTRIMLSSKCEVCDSKKSKFIKEQQASGLFSSLEIKMPQ